MCSAKSPKLSLALETVSNEIHSSSVKAFSAIVDEYQSEILECTLDKLRNTLHHMT
jgi:hypothetical protein